MKSFRSIIALLGWQLYWLGWQLYCQPEESGEFRGGSATATPTYAFFNGLL